MKFNLLENFALFFKLLIYVLYSNHILIGPTYSKIRPEGLYNVHNHTYLTQMREHFNLVRTANFYCLFKTFDTLHCKYIQHNYRSIQESNAITNKEQKLFIH